MYRVLAGIDRDEQRARRQAAGIAELPEATDSVEVLLLHVFQDNPEGAAVNQLGSVRRAAERLDDADIAYEFLEASGNPAAQIVELADEHNVDLICLSRRKRSPTGKVIFGSTTQSVLVGTDRPVMTVGRTDYTGMGTDE